MTNWKKHGFGPGTDVCCRCKKAKELSRRRSKWCSACDTEMRPRRVNGTFDVPMRGGLGYRRTGGSGDDRPYR